MNTPAQEEAINHLREFFELIEKDSVLYREVLDKIPIELRAKLYGLVAVLK